MKKILGFAFASLMLVTASASELWWTITMNDDGKIKVGDEYVNWDSAQLFANKTGYNYGGTKIGSEIFQNQLTDINMASTTLGSYNSGYSFYVELYYGSGESAKTYKSSVSSKLGAVAYSSLSANVFENSFDTPATTPYSFDNFTTTDIIPEPTSGLLVLIGALALGLKRKKEIV